MLEFLEVWIWNCARASYWLFAIIPAAVCIYWTICLLGVRRRLYLVKTEPPRPKQQIAKPISAGPARSPSVSIITAVKSRTNKSSDPVANFYSQICHEYDGATENIYVFECDKDPAIPLIRKMIKEFKGKHDIRIVISGLATTCSQKIHNMVAGVDACHPDSKYVYFLDNSTRCLRATLSRLVERLETTNDCLAASGYPLDVVPASGHASAWLMAHVRYLLLGFVNVKVNASYAWGGAMLVYKKHVMKGSDPFKIRELWVNGGIQDDMVLNSCAIENGLFAANLPAAVYFNELKKDITFPFACDFIRRQVVVAGCYHSLGARARHWGMLLAYYVLNTLGCCAQVLTVVVLLSKAGLFHFWIRDEFPIADTLALLTLPFAVLAAWIEKFMIESMGQIFDHVSRHDPINIKFPKERLGLLTIVWTWILSQWVGVFVGTYTVMHLKDIEWAGIVYSMENGRVVKVTHGVKTWRDGDPSHGHRDIQSQ